MTASLALSSSALAAPAPQIAAAGTKLKWHARGVPARHNTAATKATDESAVPARLWQTPARALTARPESARGALHNGVMQASADKSDPFKDPFEDDPVGHKTAEQESSQPSAQEELPPAAADSQAPAADEPPRLPGTGDPFPDEGRSTLDATTPDNQSIVPGTPPPLDMSCDAYKSECSKAIEALRSHDIRKIIFGVVIEGEGGNAPVEGKDYPCECTLGLNATFQGRSFAPTTFTWKAAGTCHKPLYFEDVQLERYGHSWNPVLQPFMSAGHFFVSVPLLPYKMGLTPPCECMYTLGYYRPGSCAPYMIEPIPLSLRAGVSQALGVTGFAFWFWPPPTGP